MGEYVWSYFCVVFVVGFAVAFYALPQQSNVEMKDNLQMKLKIAYSHNSEPKLFSRMVTGLIGVADLLLVGQ